MYLKKRCRICSAYYIAFQVSSMESQTGMLNFSLQAITCPNIICLSLQPFFTNIEYTRRCFKHTMKFVFLLRQRKDILQVFDANYVLARIPRKISLA